VKLHRNILAALAFLFSALVAGAQSNVTVRVMAANLTTGNDFSYYAPGINVFKGLKPDIVAIQEFRYDGSPDTNGLRTLVDVAFGTNYYFYCEPGYSNTGDKPNGIISRYPILAAGTWDDTQVNDRGYAWAQIDLPGTNDLYVVSVHLHSSGGASSRAIEATNLKSLIQSGFPAGAWIIVAGDFNTDSRTETCLNTFKSYLSDSPIPADNNGNPNTNLGRNKPYDYVLPSFSLTNRLTPVVVGSLTYPNGLVFDSRVYSANELTNFSPVVTADSGASGMQHMAVIKDFLVAAGSASATNPPAISLQPSGRTNAVGAGITFAVEAAGSGVLSYQWRFNDANLPGATTNPFVLTAAQLTNSGNYSVAITNLYGSVTSATAVLLITNAAPAITAQPSSLSVLAGQSAAFNVAVVGTAPLSFQWRFNGADLSGATTNPFVLTAAQPADAGNYSVVVSNFVGSVTSAVAVLTVNADNSSILAQWNFNSSPADGSTTTGSTAPSIGSGTATLAGGATATFATGDALADPASADNTAWNTTTYPAATANNKSTGPRFAVSTVGKQNIVVSWSHRCSNTAGKYFRLQYSTNGGTGFIDYPSAIIIPQATNFFAFTNNLSSLPGVDNNLNFVFRIVGEFQSTATGSGSAAYIVVNPDNTYAASGTVRYDMVTVRASDIVTTNPPAAPPVLGAVTLTGGQLQFSVSGTTGSNYVVQCATNLPAGTWTPLRTNPAPFIFAETNLAAPQKFYRATAQ